MNEFISKLTILQDKNCVINTLIISLYICNQVKAEAMKVLGIQDIRLHSYYTVVKRKSIINEKVSGVFLVT